MKTPLPTGEAKVATVDAMFDAIAPRYDLCNRLISLGLDVGWRRRTVRALGPPGAGVVLDLACGTGDLCRELRRVGFEAVGVDRSAGMLAVAGREQHPGRSRRPGARPNLWAQILPPAAISAPKDDGSAATDRQVRSHDRSVAAPLVQGDALRLPLRDGAVAGVVCGFALRNFAVLGPVFAECARVVRPGGRVAFLEVDTPGSAVLRAGHRVWFGGVVPAIGALLSDGAAYRYLPRSVAYLPPPGELAGMLRHAGFTDVQRTRLSGGIAQLVAAVRA